MDDPLNTRIMIDRLAEQLEVESEYEQLFGDYELVDDVEEFEDDEWDV